MKCVAVGADRRARMQELGTTEPAVVQSGNACAGVNNDRRLTDLSAIVSRIGNCDGLPRDLLSVD